MFVPFCLQPCLLHLSNLDFYSVVTSKLALGLCATTLPFRFLIYCVIIHALSTVSEFIELSLCSNIPHRFRVCSIITQGDVIRQYINSHISQTFDPFIQPYN